MGAVWGRSMTIVLYVFKTLNIAVDRNQFTQGSFGNFIMTKIVKREHYVFLKTAT